MEISTTKIILAIITLSFTLLSGWWVWWQRKTQTTVEQHDQRITRLEEKIVTAEDVRSIVHQSNEPLKSSINSLATSLSDNSKLIQDVLLRLAEKEGYERAKKDLERRNNES